MFQLRLLLALFLALAPLASSGGGGFFAGAAQAQTTTDVVTIDYEAWEEAASGAEALIDGSVASTSMLEARRAELSEWRARFLEADARNEERIATIRSQIEALGAAPEEGETEPDTIAARRATLAEALREAQAPSLRASEAFNRANGLIAEIDAIVVERQTEELLELAPTPLNPVNWATALGALADLAVELQTDTSARLQDADVRGAIADEAPLLILLILIGLVLILRGRPLVSRLGDRFLDADRRRGRVALGFLVSLGQLLLPVAGFMMVSTAFDMSGLLTDAGEAILDAALGLIIAVYAALWLGGRLFPNHQERAAAFDADMDIRRPARRAILFIGLFMGLANVAEVVAALDVVPVDARGVLVLTVYIGLAWSYWSFARLMHRIRTDAPEGEVSSFNLAVTNILARALSLVAIVGPLLAAIGFLNAAEAVMVPTAITLFMLGVLLVLQAVVRDLYAVVFRATPEAASEALLPVIVNFLLFLVATPFLAMAWGVRAERLQELYVRVLEGFTLGETRITPGVVLAVILVFAAGLLVTRMLQGALKSTVLPRTQMDVGARNAVTAGVGYVGIALASVIAVTSAGIDLTALGFVVGALSVGIGFGLQNVVSNFVSGIILLIERPISEGDWIEVAGNMGIVKDISVRSTTIETFDKTDVIVPNADFISGTVTNWTRGNTVGRAVVTVGVAYGNDTRRVSDILLDIAQNHPGVLSFPAPGVDFLGFGADSLDFRVRCILRDINELVSVKTELHHQIAERFKEEEIEIPFAQRDIWLRNPEALRQAVPAKDTPE
jgi:small-conductance mechanosensitive channel